MRRYEIMFIVDPSLPEEEIDQINGQVQTLVRDAGGEVESLEKIGRKKLAYEVGRRTDGFYVLFRVAANGAIVREVERRFRVMDPVMRYLTVRIDPEEKRLAKLSLARQKKGAAGGAARTVGPDTFAEPAGDEA